MTKDQKINHALTRAVENIYPNFEALEKVLKSGKKLKIYNGIDPTGELHIGHGVQLQKLRQLQDLGCDIVVLIGDFTAQIGDPTDKAATRQPLSLVKIKENYKNYKKLILKILDPKKTTFKFNSTWHNKLKFSDLIQLASEFSVQRLLERDMFDKRMKEGKTIGLHEFMYPLMQAYDSVALDVDMEIGGSDQTYNMLAGRTLMRSLKNKEKFVLTTKLLEDPSGKKMSKTEGSTVNLVDTPEQMYGKVMSWTDGMILPAFEIATSVPTEEVIQIKKELDNGANPKKFKMLLAYKIVELYHGAKQAIHAEEQFKQVFEEKLNPDEIPVFKTNKRNIIEVLVETKLVSSKAEARRLIVQGGVQVDNKKVTDENFEIPEPDGNGLIIQKGKRHFAKII